MESVHFVMTMVIVCKVCFWSVEYISDVRSLSTLLSHVCVGINLCRSASSISAIYRVFPECSYNGVVIMSRVTASPCWVLCI